jgi:hypothetical protein
MVTKRDEPIVPAGGTPQQILVALSKFADYPVSQQQEYICLKILHSLTKQATLQEFLDACDNHTSCGVTSKQMELIQSFVKVLRNIVW